MTEPQRRVVTRSVRNLPDDQYKACRRLGLPYHQGWMKRRLDWYRSRPANWSRITMIWEGEKLLAWSIMTRFIHPDGTKTPWDLHIYVRASHRKRGLATELIKRALRVKDRPISVYGWSYGARCLYRRWIAPTKLFDPYKPDMYWQRTWATWGS